MFADSHSYFDTRRGMVSTVGRSISTDRLSTDRFSTISSLRSPLTTALNESLKYNELEKTMKAQAKAIPNKSSL